MKRICLFLVLTAFLGACAGNPPRWWNPSGQYEENASSGPAAAPASLPAALAKEEEDPMNLEQRFDPSAESYEELTLSPYPQDEAQVEVAAPEETPISAPQEPLPLAEEASVPTQPAQTEEHLPEDGSLPPPSVLENL